MNLFYSTNIIKDVIYLDTAESRHCTKVLRKKIGDSVMALDGNGGHYNCIIHKVDQKATELQIIDKKSKTRAKQNLIIAIAPPKNSKRFDWFLKKQWKLELKKFNRLSAKEANADISKWSASKSKLISALNKANAIG